MIYDLVTSLVNGTDIRIVLPGILFTVIVVLFSLSLHEMSHGYAAYKMGDHTARNLGRLTMNPVRHLDPIGTVSMLLFGFGWAKPVPVNSRNFKKPRAGIIVTSIAGPLSNLLLSFVSIVAYALFTVLLMKVPSEIAFNPLFGFYAIRFLEEDASFVIKVAYLFSMLLYYFHSLNLSLAIFNLLPIPPLDGSKVLFMLLPSKVYYVVQKYEHIINFVLFALLFMGYLSTPISYVCSFISNCMVGLITLIPGI